VTAHGWAGLLFVWRLCNLAMTWACHALALPTICLFGMSTEAQLHIPADPDIIAGSMPAIFRSFVEVPDVLDSVSPVMAAAAYNLGTATGIWFGDGFTSLGRNGQLTAAINFPNTGCDPVCIYEMTNICWLPPLMTERLGLNTTACVSDFVRRWQLVGLRGRPNTTLLNVETASILDGSAAKYIHSANGSDIFGLLKHFEEWPQVFEGLMVFEARMLYGESSVTGLGGERGELIGGAQRAYPNMNFYHSSHAVGCGIPQVPLRGAYIHDAPFPYADLLRRFCVMYR